MRRVSPRGRPSSASDGTLRAASLAALVLATALAPASRAACPADPPAACVAWPIRACDGLTDDMLGRALAFDGRRLLLGAMGRDGAGLLSGAAYVFERDADGRWVEVAQLLGAGDSADARFGESVALDGDRIAVGSPAHWEGDVQLVGAVHVFAHDGAGWVLEQRIMEDPPVVVAGFGTSVALDGERLAVGASEGGGGRVVVHERAPDGTWPPVATLVTADPADARTFGTSVVVQGDDIMVGARSGGAGRDGLVVFFRRQVDGTWAEDGSFALGVDSLLGISVALSGDLAAAGAPEFDNRHGAAQVYRRSPGGPWEVAALVPYPGTETARSFGWAVALEGGTLVVGARRHAEVEPWEGAVFVFEEDVDGAWTEVDRLRGGGSTELAWFGSSVGIAGGVIAAGAQFQDTFVRDAGMAWVFEPCAPAPEEQVVDLRVARDPRDPSRLRLRVRESAAEPPGHDVHAGAMGAWYSHVALECAAASVPDGAGWRELTVAAPASSTYLLVAAADCSSGPAGCDSFGVQRPIPPRCAP